MATDTDDANLPTNKPKGSLVKSWPKTRATRAQILASLASLELNYGRLAMTDAEREVWLRTWCEDLQNKTNTEIIDGCRRYRQNAANKFFPTPGQLLEACRSPYADHPNRYGKLEPLPESMSVERAAELIERTRKKYGFPKTKEDNLVALKEEILARPPIVMTPELEAREKALADERAATLEQRLRLRHG